MTRGILRFSGSQPILMRSTALRPMHIVRGVRAKGDTSEYLRDIRAGLDGVYCQYAKHGSVDNEFVAECAGEPQPHASATVTDQPVSTGCAKRQRFVIAAQKRDRIGPDAVATCAVAFGTSSPSSRCSVERLEFVEQHLWHNQRRRRVRRHDPHVDGIVDDPVDR